MLIFEALRTLRPLFTLSNSSSCLFVNPVVPITKAGVSFLLMLFIKFRVDLGEEKSIITSDSLMLLSTLSVTITLSSVDPTLSCPFASTKYLILKLGIFFDSSTMAIPILPDAPIILIFIIPILLFI